VSEQSFLEEISIRNLGIIEESHLELSPGLNVLTGETGAGKTMILTALHLVLGGKTDSALVRHSTERLTATATFSLPSKTNKDLLEQVESSGCAIEDNQLILSRSVTSEGKSKAAVNGTTIPASVLTELSSQLIEIHGQSANIQLTKPARQRELLDRFGGSAISSAHSEYTNSYLAYLELKDRIKSMKSTSSKRDAEIAELEEFLSGWTKLKAVRNEYSSTVDEISRLSSVEDLRVASTQAVSGITDEDSGALTSLGIAKRALENAKGRDSRLDAISEQVSESFFILDEAARELSSYQSSLEADPDRLNMLQERRATLNSFLKKWAGSGDPDYRIGVGNGGAGGAGGGADRRG
jgi:DNA repair protein RecN (Recombination protein N)